MPSALLASLLCLADLFVSQAAANPALDQAQSAFAQQQAAYRKDPQSIEAAWQFARSCFDLADFATNRAQRAELAEQGIAACRQALARQSNSAPLHYYLGLNLGQLARTRTLGALRLVSEMEKEFTAASQLDSSFDHAGPDRSLGLLYRDAPAFGSIGSRPKARERLQRALELAPQYPENSLILIESELKWNDRLAARAELKALEERLPKARAEFSGAAWASNWTEWDLRVANARKALEDVARK
jgi:tetratricopeptide (TPR) repeat protein